LKHYDLGLRYAFSEKVGAKIWYKSDKFVNSENEKEGVNYMTMGLSGFYNLGKELGINFATRETLGLHAHLDAGVGFVDLFNRYDYERIGLLGLGLTPICKISNKIALSGDFTYNITVKQHYGFDGILLNESYEPTSGNFFNFSMGLIFYLGENKHHMDWY
jgi:OOP family OmpA-OmpF porin